MVMRPRTENTASARPPWPCALAVRKTAIRATGASAPHRISLDFEGFSAIYQLTVRSGCFDFVKPGPLERSPKRLDHALLILGPDLREERQWERPGARALRYREHAFTEAVLLAHERLQMDARDVLRGADPLSAKVRHHSGTVDLRRELEDVDEPGASVLGIVGERRLGAVDAGEQLPVPLRRCRTQLQDPVELLQLGDPQRRLDVGPAVVVAEPHVIEPGAGVVGAALVSQAAEQLPFLFGVCDDDAALARRDLLVRIEAEDGRRPVPAERRALVLGS